MPAITLGRIKLAGLSHLILPLLFVFLYGSGFVGAKLGLPHAGPFSFLFLRFALAAVVMTAIALAMRAPWPKTGRESIKIAIAGLLGVGTFSIAAYLSIQRGLPPAVSALIVALNPIVVALAAGPLLGEKTNPKQFLGLVIGIGGVVVVLWERLAIDQNYWVAALLSVLALVGLACGNLWQKKHCGSMNLFTGGAIQTAACATVMAVGAAVVEEGPVHFVPEFMVAWLWTALAISIGAISIFYSMIRRAEVSRVASLFFLMPASAAILQVAIFGQQLSAMALTGMAITGLGVFLAARR